MGRILANIDDIESDKSDISRAEIHQIACCVSDDEADPRDVRRLLEYIYDLVDRQNPPTVWILPPEIQRYVMDSLRVFLDGSAKSLDAAFGLKQRRRGPRKKVAAERRSMATEVMRLRLAGSNHRKALGVVAKQFIKSESVISDAWAAWKDDALIALRLERPLDKFPWSDKEVQLLEEIFEKEQAFLKKLGYLAPNK